MGAPSRHVALLFEEYPYVGWAMFPWMQERPDGMWQFPEGTVSLPLMFSLTASKPQAAAP